LIATRNWVLLGYNVGKCFLSKGCLCESRVLREVLVILIKRLRELNAIVLICISVRELARMIWALSDLITAEHVVLDVISLVSHTAEHSLEVVSTHRARRRIVVSLGVLPMHHAWVVPLQLHRLVFFR
jgi:hypothetical protein